MSTRREPAGRGTPGGARGARHRAPSDEDGDKLIFIFDGGLLSEADRASIRVDGDEVLDHGFHAVEAVRTLTIPPYARRIEQAAQARIDNSMR